MAQVRKTATYRVVTDSGGSRIFRFCCDISGELCCVTRPIRADNTAAAAAVAKDVTVYLWGDVNRDGAVAAADAQEIQCKAAGLSSTISILP